MKRAYDPASTLEFSSAKRANDSRDENVPPDQRFIEIVEVPNEYAAILSGIGTGVQNLRSIEVETGCKITVGDRITKQDTKFITFIGTRMVIDIAKATVNELLVSFFPPKNLIPEDRFTECLMIPGHKCGLIIGKNGDTIRSLQEQLGVRLLLIQESVAVSMEKPLRIQGEYAKVMFAKDEILKMIHAEVEPVSIPIVTNNTSIEMEIPRFAVGFVIGKRGENIRKMSLDSECHLSFEFEDVGSPTRMLTIQGPHEKVKVAKKMVKDLVARCRQNCIKNESIDIVSVTVSPAKAGLIIGRSGEKIKQINQESGAYVELSREASKGNDRVFTIKGSPQQIEYAVYLIKMKVREDDGSSLQFTEVVKENWTGYSAGDDGNQVYSNSFFTDSNGMSWENNAGYHSHPLYTPASNTPGYGYDYGIMYAEYCQQMNIPYCPVEGTSQSDGRNTNSKRESIDDSTPPGC